MDEDKLTEEKERLRPLMEAASRSLLAERKVEIILRKNLVRGTYASANLLKSGKFVIQIDPDPFWSLESYYTVWLHELSHCYLNHCKVIDMDDFPKIPKVLILFPDPITTPEEAKSYREDPEEIEANNFAEFLDSWALEKAKSLPGGASVENRLYAFCNMVLKPIQQEEK